MTQSLSRSSLYEELEEKYSALSTRLVRIENEIGDIFKRKEMLEELIKEQDKAAIVKQTQYDAVSKECERMKIAFKALVIEDLIYSHQL